MKARDIWQKWFAKVPLFVKRVVEYNDCHTALVLICLFSFCALVYYLGEIIDITGLSALRLPIFYTIHDVHRMLFLVPIAHASYYYRIKGAAGTTLAALLVFLPRALFVSPYPEPVVRIIIFSLFAGLFGFMIAIMVSRGEGQVKLKALAMSERDRFFGMLEKVGDGICIISPDYRLRFVNEVLRNRFGENNGKLCYQYFFALDKPCGERCALAKVIGGESAVHEYVFPDGETFELLSSPIITDGAACQVTTMRNVSRYKRTELELLGLSQLKSDVLSNLSHEFKSPLTSMRGAVSTLLQKDIQVDSDTRDQMLVGVLEETRRLERLVTNLLDISKLEAGVWKPVKKPCNIFDLVNETVGRFSWGHREHVFEIIADSDLPELPMDYAQIRQVLINLLDNAAKYSADGTKICVSVLCRNGSVELCVSDEGPGIAAEDTAKLFTKFYRGKQRRQQSGGVGLGLAICQAIVTSHNGRIWADSRAGQGSKFFFTLPV